VRSPAGQGGDPDRERAIGDVPPPAGSDPAEAFPGDYIRASLETSLRASGPDAFDVLQFHVWSDDWVGRGDWLTGPGARSVSTRPKGRASARAALRVIPVSLSRPRDRFRLTPVTGNL
jgi:aryl-alcohol dehydrogenase-like predicted oxidoreductase